MKPMSTGTDERFPYRKSTMQRTRLELTRRGFLKTALQAGAILAAPQIVRGAVLGKDGGTAPSERIMMGASASAAAALMTWAVFYNSRTCSLSRFAT